MNKKLLALSSMILMVLTLIMVPGFGLLPPKPPEEVQPEIAVKIDGTWLHTLPPPWEDLEWDYCDNIPDMEDPDWAGLFEPFELEAPAFSTTFTAEVWVLNVTKLYSYEFRLVWNYGFLDLESYELLPLDEGMGETHLIDGDPYTAGMQPMYVQVWSHLGPGEGFTGSAKVADLVFHVHQDPVYPDAFYSAIYILSVEAANPTTNPIELGRKHALVKLNSVEPEMSLTPEDLIIVWEQDKQIKFEIDVVDAVKMKSFELQLEWGWRILESWTFDMAHTWNPYVLDCVNVTEIYGNPIQIIKSMRRSMMEFTVILPCDYFVVESAPQGAGNVAFIFDSDADGTPDFQIKYQPEEVSAGGSMGNSATDWGYSTYDGTIWSKDDLGYWDTPPGYFECYKEPRVARLGVPIDVLGGFCGSDFRFAIDLWHVAYWDPNEFIEGERETLGACAGTDVAQGVHFIFPPKDSTQWIDWCDSEDYCEEPTPHEQLVIDLQKHPIVVTDFLPGPYETYEVNVDDKMITVKVIRDCEKLAINGTGVIVEITLNAISPWGKKTCSIPELCYEKRRKVVPPYTYIDGICDEPVHLWMPDECEAYVNASLSIDGIRCYQDQDWYYEPSNIYADHYDPNQDDPYITGTQPRPAPYLGYYKLDPFDLDPDVPYSIGGVWHVGDYDMDLGSLATHYDFRPISGDFDMSGHVGLEDIMAIAEWYGAPVGLIGDLIDAGVDPAAAPALAAYYWDTCISDFDIVGGTVRPESDGEIDIFDMTAVAKQFCVDEPFHWPWEEPYLDP